MRSLANTKFQVYIFNFPDFLRSSRCLFKFPEFSRFSRFQLIVCVNFAIFLTPDMVSKRYQAWYRVNSLKPPIGPPPPTMFGTKFVFALLDVLDHSESKKNHDSKKMFFEVFRTFCGGVFKHFFFY